jgi:hypothetical protein
MIGNPTKPLETARVALVSNHNNNKPTPQRWQDDKTGRAEARPFD